MAADGLEQERLRVLNLAKKGRDSFKAFLEHIEPLSEEELKQAMTAEDIAQLADTLGQIDRLLSIAENIKAGQVRDDGAGW